MSATHAITMIFSLPTLISAMLAPIRPIRPPAAQLPSGRARFAPAPDHHRHGTARPHSALTRALACAFDKRAAVVVRFCLIH
jgi:hypothetical protein